MSTHSEHKRRDKASDGTGTVIHLFAAAHAAITVVARMLDYYDDIPLTVLSISMIAVIASRKRFPVELTAVLILIVTFTGYLAGLYFGQVLYGVIGSWLAASAIVTFLLTEAFGWSASLLARYERIPISDNRSGWIVGTRQIIIVASAILLFRITYSLLFRAPYFAERGGIYAEFGRVFANTFAMLTLVCGNAIFTALWRRRDHAIRNPWRDAAAAAFIALFPVPLALIVYCNFPLSWEWPGEEFDIRDLAGLYAVTLLTTIIVFAVFALIRYVVASRKAIYDEREKKHQEQYKYTKLKQQINPHFLFNSLNILDFLVQSGENERAGAYIRKLAGLYRYMLKNEDEVLVSVGEELSFTDMYIDLLKERFADGLIIEKRIPEAANLRHVVPCGVQMLIENATKHNTVSAASPLHITISADDEMLTVSNNLQPRISRQPSTRLGLANIRRQYADIAGREIEIDRNEKHFTVRLPLL